MARQTRKMSALEISRIREPGKHPVGESLYLQVSKTGSRSWMFRYSFLGKSRWMGLGGLKTISLKEAREKVLDMKKALKDGNDPLLLKDQKKREQKLQDARLITFDQCASQYIEAHKPKWKSRKNLTQWENSLKTYASPIIGSTPVADIDLPLVMKVLDPIWYSKTETASRVRARMERIISWATVRGYRAGSNPAVWKGFLDQLLPNKSQIHKVKHFKAMPFEQVGSFVAELRKNEGIASRALEFLILTATRTNETLGATWDEINLEEKYWLIPSERMKNGKEHKVPLSPKAMDILFEMKKIQVSEFVFPGNRSNQPLSEMSLLMVLRRMNQNVTAHGFRSTFKDWATERTNFSFEVSEMALAHTIKNKVEAAYRRRDLFLKRQKLMDTWAEFCYRNENQKASVINFDDTFESKLQIK